VAATRSDSSPDSPRRFAWMSKLSDEDAAAVPLAEPGVKLADGDEYVDATSPKRGRVQALEGEFVPQGGVYILKSTSDPGLWERIGEAIR
jgi:hypothetical protein